jgi:hypothetical protein
MIQNEPHFIFTVIYTACVCTITHIINKNILERVKYMEDLGMMNVNKRDNVYG